MVSYFLWYDNSEWLLFFQTSYVYTLYSSNYESWVDDDCWLGYTILFMGTAHEYLNG